MMTMPSSPGYVRDYAQEAKTAKARGEQGVGHNSGNAIRNRARYSAIKKGMIPAGSKKDIDHKKALSMGGAATASTNLRAVSAHDNRSFPRNSDGSMKSNT
jgi:hypothetical protein